MLKAKLLSLIEDVLHQVILFGTVSAAPSSLNHLLVLLFLIDESVIIITILIFLFIYLLCDRFLSWT